MTWREQQRAAEQMRQTVGRLNAEMGVYSGKQRLVAGAQKAGLMAAGVMAGAAVVAPKVNRAFSYDEQLAHGQHGVWRPVARRGRGQEAAVCRAPRNGSHNP